jgi:hypothetical protein
MRRCFGGVLCLICFLAGPATGLAHAVHLAHAGPHHDSSECPVCVQLTVGSTAPAVEAAVSPVDVDTLSFKSPCPAQVLVPTDEHAGPLGPRAPPLLS